MTHPNNHAARIQRISDAVVAAYIHDIATPRLVLDRASEAHTDLRSRRGRRAARTAVSGVR
jgi:hypothetical protein